MITCLNNFCTEHLLSQIILQPTHYQGNILDLVMTNNTSLIHDYNCVPTLRSISHHLMINVQTQYKSLNISSNEEQQDKLSPLDRLNFHSKDVNWELFNEALLNINWVESLQERTPDEMLETLYNAIQEISQAHVPQRKKPLSKRNRVTRLKNNFKRRKQRINSQLRNHPSLARRNNLQNELIQVEVKLQKLYKESNLYHENKAVDAIKDNVKYFYSYAKKRSKVKVKVGPLLNEETNTLTMNSAEMADLLATQYDSVFSSPSTTPPLIEESSLPINNIVIVEQEIIDAIEELKSSAASGADGVPAILFKKCKEALSNPLTIFWNACMINSHIPETLKLSIITPLHKGGSKSEAANYRPVALTSHIIKIYEKAIRKRITVYLESIDGLNKNQHGFRSGRSCLTQLLAHYDNIICLLEEGHNVDVIYLDFAKAFDKVDHNILLKKAHALGIQGKTLKWIQAFLQNRQQRVIVNGNLSSPHQVISGVPQGSVIGPLLFLILISDIDKNTMHSTVSSFADDTRVTKGLTNEIDAVDLQNDIFQIYGWSEENNMQFNSLKFEVLRYGRNSELKDSTSYVSPEWEVIEEKSSLRDLGVTMSADTTFTEHINKIIESAKRMSSWVLRTFNTRDRIPMLTLYKSLVRPLLEYSSALWSPNKKGDIQRLEEVQQSFVRKIKGVSRDYHTALKQLNLYSLERRRERYTILHIWKILENKTTNLSETELSKISLQTGIPHRRGRTCMPHNLARTPSHLQQARQQTIRCKGVQLFNKLPKHIRNTTQTTLDSFKSTLDKFYRSTDDLPSLRHAHADSAPETNHAHPLHPINPLPAIIPINRPPHVEHEQFSAVSQHAPHSAMSSTYGRTSVCEFTLVL